MDRKLFLIILLPVLFLLASAPVEQAGDKNIIYGRLIVQVVDGGNRDAVLLHLESKYSDAGLVRERCLSPELGIWLFSHGLRSASERLLLDQMRKEKHVANAQFDHYISLREVIPDDPEFANQWALKNTGQSGGVPDADIDATDAWDITVNTGVSIMGDTLVMAIVDDGFSMSHPDMYYWKNRQEIPGNGVDDDGNGYVDDYDGWNAYYHSGYIQPKDHGQHVAGIAGARGNNGIGVCGINWNGRVMTVCGSSEMESTVVEAYAYVYKMRSLYDETGGQKGAYVVVTNSSFGVDQGDPEDYPIWNAMYDSLGSIGIMNVAATSNGPWNVDVYGDIPTAFTVDHLIAVTNTTPEDEKNLSAAWGPVSIDLGAPGKSIMSTRIPDTYGYKTGTSMASPQVTGSIALMFSAADTAFYQRYHQAPRQLSLFMKYILLDAVDTLTGFDTLCVSAGRLNVNKAIHKLINLRIGLESDTLKVLLGIDSTVTDTFQITNLVGFNLPYVAMIENMPGWINFDPPAEILPGGGSEQLLFYFNAVSLSAGKYYCEMEFTDIAGMSTVLVIEMEVIPTQSVSETEKSPGEMYCFPNPFSSSLNISLEVKQSSEVVFLVYSLAGELADHRRVTIYPGDNFIRWDGCDKNGMTLPSGIYLVKVYGGDVNEVQRVVKLP